MSLFHFCALSHASLIFSGVLRQKMQPANKTSSSSKQHFCLDLLKAELLWCIMQLAVDLSEDWFSANRLACSGYPGGPQNVHEDAPYQSNHGNLRMRQVSICTHFWRTAEELWVAINEMMVQQPVGSKT
jgi:hypothetical protein